MIDQWRERYGEESVRIVRNHSKICRVWNDDFKLLIRGSMNFNYNPRFEQLDITEGGPEFDLVERIESELPALPGRPVNAEVEHATGISRAFEYSSLKMFAGVKPWKA